MSSVCALCFVCFRGRLKFCCFPSSFTTSDMSSHRSVNRKSQERHRLCNLSKSNELSVLRKTLTCSKGRRAEEQRRSHTGTTNGKTNRKDEREKDEHRQMRGLTNGKQDRSKMCRSRNHKTRSGDSRRTGCVQLYYSAKEIRKYHRL